MGLLKAEPSGPVRTLDELFALAYELEQAAARRYNEFARRMRQEGADVLAGLFERLAAEERSHVDAVVRWSEREEGRPPDPSRMPWPPPETMDAEGADAFQPQLLTPYKALSIAVRNEERAFAFWSYVAAHSEAADIRQAAEELAAAELDHAALLRRHRRRAFHEMRKGDREVQPTAAMERRLADACDRLSELTDGERSARLKVIAADARRTADEAQVLMFPPPAGTAGPGQTLVEAVDLAEALVDRYLEAAEQGKEEAMVAKAQSLAEAAIARLAWLRSNAPSETATAIGLHENSL
jgi:rubrerythrin